MSDLSTPSTPTLHARRHRTVARWMVTLVGFPLGGLLSSLLVGPVDRPVAALAGGLLTGAVVGVAQWWGLGRVRPRARDWVAATAVGLMVGLGLGAAVVGYGATLGAAVVEGALCGLSVGVAQAVVLRSRLGRMAFAWPPALAVVWAAGWAVTTSVGVQLDQQFTVFGSSGAVVVTALTAVLPVLLARRAASAS